MTHSFPTRRSSDLPEDVVMPAPLRDKRRDLYMLPDGGTARSLVYASGAWLTELFPQILTPQRLSAVRHQIFHFGPGQGDTQFRPLAMPALVDRAYGFNLLPDIEGVGVRVRSEEHTSELQSLMRSSY